MKMMSKVLGAMVVVTMMSACSSSREIVYTDHNCNTCTTSYTVSKPVEVIYKDVTYTTVYEPKTYKSTSFTRKPYNKCVEKDLCR